MKKGELTAIVGCMFSSKTKTLEALVETEQIAGNNVRAFKPTEDNRYSVDEISTHDGITLEATCVPGNNPGFILSYAVENDLEVAAIEEAQFFSDELYSVIEDLQNRGIDVIICGLDLDFKAQPFGVMPKLLALADHVIKRNAVCVVCNSKNANRSQRIISGRPAKADSPVVLVGEKDFYEARCIDCYVPPFK